MLAAMKGRLKLVLATKAVHPRAIEPEKIVEKATMLGFRSKAVIPVEAALMTGTGAVNNRWRISIISRQYVRDRRSKNGLGKNPTNR